MTPTTTGTKMISAIVVTHGRLGAEFVATAHKILGDFAGVYSLSNEDKTPQMLAEEIESIMEHAGRDDSFILLVDFLYGSCGHATLAVERNHRNVRIVSGVNLPMVLAFLNKRNEVNFERLPSELAARGRDSIQSVDTDQL
jgi:mannose/fructose-specific phosphotransferase system component IIA